MNYMEFLKEVDKFYASFPGFDFRGKTLLDEFLYDQDDDIVLERVLRRLADYNHPHYRDPIEY